MCVAKQGKQIQGLWRSASGAELSLVATPGGVIVGTYRVNDPNGVKQYALSGHAVAGHVAFSVPFPAEEVIASWTGRMIRDDGGSRLEFVRRLVGHGVDGVQSSTADSFRRVEAEGPSATGVAFPAVDGGTRLQ